MPMKTTLTVRLTVLYTLVAASVLAGMAVLVLMTTHQHFVELDQAFMLDKAKLIQESEKGKQGLEEVSQRIKEIAESHHGMYLQLWSNKALVVGSSALEVPQLLSTADKPPGQLVDWVANGTSLRGLSQDVELKSDAGIDQMRSTVTARLILAVETHHHAMFQTSLAKTLAVFVLLATALSGFLGWWAARTGLSPLRVMRERATKVTASKLNHRMPVGEVPVEMADLATSLNEMLERLEADFVRLQDFSGDLAHELRTPLNNLLTQTQVALSHPRDAASYRDTLASNAEEYQRLARMVSDMLFLAKADRGIALPNPEKLELSDEVSALFEFYEAVAEDLGIELKAEGHGQVFGDRLMIRRAISNLLSNALRHAAKNTKITVAVVPHESEVTLSVSNKGTPIGREHLSRLFDRFYRVDKARTRPESDGAGLGLAITSAIMQAHRGQIDVVSEAERTTFSLHFPSPALDATHELLRPVGR